MAIRQSIISLCVFLPGGNNHFLAICEISHVGDLKNRLDTKLLAVLWRVVFLLDASYSPDFTPYTFNSRWIDRLNIWYYLFSDVLMICDSKWVYVVDKIALRCTVSANVIHSRAHRWTLFFVRLTQLRGFLHLLIKIKSVSKARKSVSVRKQ